MKVAVYYANDDLRIEEYPIPDIGEHEILLEVHASGICGSDVMEWYRIHKIPLVLGHEVAGKIVEIGSKVSQYRVGQRISASHHVPCNTCHYCLKDHHTVCETLRSTNFDPGGFAEYVRIPSINVDRGIYLLPDEVSYEEATFIEPLACCIRGQRMANIQQGDCVLIMGCGTAGILHISLSRVKGAGLIVATDIVDFRLKLAKKFGADVTINANEDVPYEFQKINNGKLADVVIICTGAPSAIEQAFSSIDRGGTILFFAPTEKGRTIPLPVNDLFWRNEITLTSSYAANRKEHLDALNLIKTKKIKVKEMITHRLPLEQIQIGFKMVAEGRNSLKVIIEPNR
jgi:L-iditol 2-dehydrogenase